MPDGGFGSRRSGGTTTTKAAPETSSGGFGSRRSSTPSTNKKSKKSAGGFLSNIAGDVAEGTYGAVVALPAVGEAAWDLLGQSGGSGSKSTEKTERLVKGVRDQYKQNYGSRKGFLNYLYNDPLFLALDVLTVVSAGTTGAAKAGLIASKAGKTSKLVAQSGKVVEKPLARKELRAQLQDAVNRAGNAEIKAGRHTLREGGQGAAKAAGKRSRARDVNVRAADSEYNAALAKITGLRHAKNGKHMMAATYLRSKFDRQALNEWTTQLRAVAAGTDDAADIAKRTLGVVEHPKVQAFFDVPTLNMRKVLDEARALGEKQRGLLELDDAVAEAARFRPARIAGGAKWSDEANDWVGGPSIEELKARGHDPIYMPDTSTIQRGGGYGGRGGGIGVPLTPGNAKRNKGVLQMTGQLVMDPRVLNDSFLAAAKFAHYTDIHNELLAQAKAGTHLRDGWTLIRKKRSDRVPATERGRSDFEEFTKQYLDDRGEIQHSKGWLTGKENDLLTTDPADAVTVDGKYLMVPNAVAKKLAGEFTRQAKFTYMLNRYPMRVWRALVLGLRPAYLVNNMIGNTLMYIVHSSSPQDVKYLAEAFKQFVKPAQRGQIDRMLEKQFAGQVRGGFVATQMPDLRPSGRAAKAATAVVDFIPKIDRRWEQALRRAKVKAELKKHPQLREAANRMGKETSYFERADQVLDTNPIMAEQVYDRVNDALGNYDTMSAFERGAIRNLFPFYAWYRAITGVTLKLAIEQPLKVNLLTRLGQVALDENLKEAGWNKEDIPSSLLGFVPTRRDDGRVRGYNTAPLNPYATTAQLAEFANALLPGGKRAGPKIPGGNPLLLDLVAYLQGKNMSGYTSPDVPGMGTVEGIPLYRLFEAFTGRAPSGDTFNDRDALDELLRFSGVPYARVSPRAAKRVADR